MNLKRYASAIKSFKECLEASRALYGLAETDRFAVEKQRDDEIREMRETVNALQRSGWSDTLFVYLVTQIGDALSKTSFVFDIRVESVDFSVERVSVRRGELIVEVAKSILLGNSGDN